MRPVRLVALSLLALALSACQGASPPANASVAASGGSRIREIVARGTLRVGLSGDQPPFNMTARDGRLIGFEVDVVEALGDGIGLEVALVKRSPSRGSCPRSSAESSTS